MWTYGNTRFCKFHADYHDKLFLRSLGVLQVSRKFDDKNADASALIIHFAKIPFRPTMRRDDRTDVSAH